MQVGMTMPVMEPDLDAAVLRDWARVVDEALTKSTSSQPVRTPLSCE